ncbi:MAG: hypothetical protein ACI37O_04230 [Candidatus Avelusimicrobium sp.]|uniref:hypothetical protein n=1 Tax=Candidatus Avelusimicrobium sp. TaxID=3048833 RepID=UPI003F10BFFC
MWETLLKAVLTAGAVWSIAALSAKLAQKSAALEQEKKEALEREKVENMVDSVANLPADNVRRRLQNIGRKK